MKITLCLQNNLNNIILKTLLRYIILTIVTLMALSLVGCTNQNERKSSQDGVVDMSTEGRQMPAFYLPSPLSEDTFTSSESFKNKVVLVSFFASWCRSCLEEIPLLKKLQKRFADKDFVLLAMAVDKENESGLKNLIQKQNINYPVLLADDAVKKDFGGIVILPTMFLVDREGKLYKKYSGHIDRDSLVQDIRHLVKGS
jgi:thiol-disulfide isomerase/thioredoxin